MLSVEQCAAFAENGWLVIRGAVAAARVEALEAALDAVVPETLYAHGYAGRVVEIASISRGSAALLEHAHDRGTAALAAAALAMCEQLDGNRRRGGVMSRADP